MGTVDTKVGKIIFILVWASLSSVSHSNYFQTIAQAAWVEMAKWEKRTKCCCFISHKSDLSLVTATERRLNAVRALSIFPLTFWGVWKLFSFQKFFISLSPPVLWKIPAEKCFSRVNETWEVGNSRQSFVCRRRLFAFCYLSTAHRSQSCSDWGTAEVKMFINFELFLFYFSRKTLPLSSEVEESFSRSNKPWISTHFNAELKQERRRTCKH